MSKRIVVVGSSNADRIMKLPRLPAVGETVSDGVFGQAFGGKGANQAVAAARAGGNVVFLNAVGADAEGAAMVKAFAADGIDTSRMVVSSDLPSGAALVLFDGEGRNYLAVAPGANYALRPEHIARHEAVFGDAAIVVLQNEIPADTAEAAMNTAHARGVPVLLNYAPVRDRGISLSPLVATLVVNENEAAELVSVAVSDRESAFAAGESLLSHGISTVIVTLGADGLVALESTGTRFHLPAFAVKAVDTTAAGDTFCGALAVALVENQPLANACRFASAASALSVTGAGAQPSIPRRAQIQAFLAAR